MASSRRNGGPSTATSTRSLETSLDEEKDRLTKTITRWNEHRLDLFEISLPDERGHFYGVIRFFFQNGGHEVLTKCIRVYSTATSRTVVEALAEKFGLNSPSSVEAEESGAASSRYTLYEVHQNGEERKLYSDECPLLVQLNWAKGHRDGRFVFRTAPLPSQDPSPTGPLSSSAARKEKKKRKRRFSGISIESGSAHKMADPSVESSALGSSLACSVFSAVAPESHFTRSISNPEAVMRRQRHQKMVKRILSIRSKEGSRPGSSGHVHIYAGSLAPEEPFKTLTVARETMAEDVIRIALEEFGCMGGNPLQYSLVPMCVPVTSGRNLHLNIIGTSPSQPPLSPQDLPLEVQRSQRWDKKDSVMLFHLKKAGRRDEPAQEVDPGLLPHLLEVTPTGEELESGVSIELSLQRTILGGSRPASPLPGKYVSLLASDLMPQHCEISDIEGAFTVAPLDEGAEVFVNNRPVHRQAFLTQSSLLRLGSRTTFSFQDPFQASRIAAITGTTATPHQNTSAHHSNTSTHHQNTSAHHSNTSTHHQNSSSHRHRHHHHHHQQQQQHGHGGHKAVKPASSPLLRERALSHNALEVGEGSVDPAHHHLHPLRPALSGELQQPGAESGKQLLRGGKGLGSCGPNVMSMPSIPPPSSHPAHTPPHTTHSSANPAHLSANPAHSSSNPRRRSSDSGLLGGGELRSSFLPASISFHPTKEGPLLSNMILEAKVATLRFKLAPAFALYMVARHHLSPQFQPGAQASELRKHLVVMLKNSAAYMKKAVKDARNSTQALAFWMANASEFLHFLNLDPDLYLLSSDYQQPLTSIVHSCFKSFFVCASRELAGLVPAFFDDSEEADIEDSTHSDNEEGSLSSDPSRYITGMSNGSVGGGTPHGSLTRGNHPSSSTSSLGSRSSRRSRRQRPNLGDVMAILSSALGLLRKNCVNTSLTMQAFSLLVQLLNTKILNRLVTDPSTCSLASGQRLARRLGRIESWSGQQGLELAIGRHLAQSVQAAALLAGPKYSPDDLSRLPPLDCLNSKQIETLLEHYRMGKGEPPLSPSLAHHLIMSARMKRDKLLVRDGRKVSAEEESGNPTSCFDLPTVGYLGQAVQGVPPGLEEYTKAFVTTGLCVMSFSPDPLGLWTHPSTASTPLSSESSCGDPTPCKDASDPGHAHSTTEPKVVVLEMAKINGSLGISITGGKNAATSHPDLGIFVKKLVSGGSAEKDGRLQPGDQLLNVDRRSLQGLTQEQAAHVLKNTESVTTLTVAKLAAQFYKVMNIINQPSPKPQHKTGLLEGGVGYTAGSSHAVKQSRRLEREREGGRSSSEQPLKPSNTPAPSLAADKWAKEAPQDQWRTPTIWNNPSYPPPPPSRDGGPPGKEEVTTAHSSFSLPGPAHQPLVEPHQGHSHPGPIGYPNPSQLMGRDGSAYNFVSQDPPAQSSQPQPSSQPHPQGGVSSQLNSYASCSMDVQHSSLTGNSLPHAMSVIAQYDPPPQDPHLSRRGPKDLILDQQLDSLVGLRERVREAQGWIRILESRRTAEERCRQLVERELSKHDPQQPQASMSAVGGDFPSHRYQSQVVEELEGKRRQANSNLKQIEVELHSARTTLQTCQHQLKMTELSLEAEEAERKFHKLRTSEFSDHPPESTTATEGEGGGKGRSYDLQRIGDGKEMSLGVTPCPPTSVQHHSTVSGYGSLTRGSKHTRQKSLDPTQYPGGGPPPSASHIKEEGTVPVHYRSKSEGPGEFPTGDPSKPLHQCISSGVRQPGVGGWDHQPPPPRPIKPSSSSESSALQPITLHDQVQHFNLSPTSESDFVVFPRPPPPGVDWSGSHDNHQMSAGTVAATKGPSDSPPPESLNPLEPSSNLKKWADLHTWKKSSSDWQLKPHTHNAGGSHDHPPQGSTAEDAGVSPYSPRNPNQYNFVGDFPTKEDPAPHSAHSELQFHSPPMTSQEVTSSQVTSFQDDMPSLEPYLMHNRLVSPATQDSQDGLNVRTRSTRDNSRVYPFAYTSKDQVVPSYQRDVSGPQTTSHDITTPRVLPITTRNKLQPQFSHHSNHRAHAKRDRKLPPGNLPAVSKTEL